ncbi:MAG TPA: hypothetical protein VGA44_02620, partial [Steroidobacteraceae bacterium]
AAGVAPTGENYAVDDPLAATLACVQEGCSIEQRCDALLGLQAVFGADLPRNPAFVAPVRAAYLDLWRDGALAVARAAASGS